MSQASYLFDLSAIFKISFWLSINIISNFFIFFNMFAAQLAFFASFPGCSRLCLDLSTPPISNLLVTVTKWGKWRKPSLYRPIFPQGRTSSNPQRTVMKQRVGFAPTLMILQTIAFTPWLPPHFLILSNFLYILYQNFWEFSILFLGSGVGESPSTPAPYFVVQRIWLSIK